MLATSGSDLTNYNLVDGFLGLGSKNNAEDFIDQAFKDGLIDVNFGDYLCDLFLNRRKSFPSSSILMGIKLKPS